MTSARSGSARSVEGGPCRHAEGVREAEPLTPDGCQECIAAGEHWVHLRMCITCGFVGCCDSARGQHADAHFRATAHPVMRSIEPGEPWRWCYVHEQVV